MVDRHTVPSPSGPLRAQSLDERLRALAHPARRDLIAACLDRPRPAGELVDLLDLAPASVFEHLKCCARPVCSCSSDAAASVTYLADAAVVKTTSAALDALVSVHG